MNVTYTTSGSNSPIAGRDVIMKADHEPTDDATRNPEAVHASCADKQNGKVFVVHGHDTDLRNRVEQLLFRIGLEPIILMNEPNGGLTIIEKIEQNDDVGYALVLYTACDLGRARAEARSRPRARQNVVFEHGYLIARLGRDRVAAIVEDGVETPGDVDGVVYIALSDSDWKLKVMKEMRAAGLTFDATRT